jgi:hypothetical protein
MKEVQINLTLQEADSLVRALDLAVKAHGLMMAQDVLPIVGKITQAAENSQEEPESSLEDIATH